MGNLNGLYKNKKIGYEKDKDIPLAKIPLGCLHVTLTIKVGGSFDFSVYPNTDTFKIELGGSLYMKAALEFGIGKVASIEAGIRGDFIKVTFSTTFRKNWDNNSFYKDKISLRATGGNVNTYATAKVWIWTVFSAEYEIFKGFQISEITW